MTNLINVIHHAFQPSMRLNETFMAKNAIFDRFTHRHLDK